MINEAEMREIRKGTEMIQRKYDHERVGNLVYNIK